MDKCIRLVYDYMLTRNCPVLPENPGYRVDYIRGSKPALNGIYRWQMWVKLDDKFNGCFRRHKPKECEMTSFILKHCVR